MEAILKQLQQIRLSEVVRAYFIFAIIFVPVAWLFLAAESVVGVTGLVVYIILLSLGSLILLMEFLLILAEQLGVEKPDLGRLLLASIVYWVWPLAVLKLIGLAIWQLLPTTHQGGLWCEFVELVQRSMCGCNSYQKAVDYILHTYQDGLNLLILGVLGGVVFLAGFKILISLWRK